jgi:hypothetical protein
MKKLLALAFFLFAPSAFAFPSLTITPTMILFSEIGTLPISITSNTTNWSDLNVAIYPDDLTNNSGLSCSFIQSNQNTSFADLITPLCSASSGLYHIVGYSRSDGTTALCQSGTYATCIGTSAYTSTGSHNIDFTVFSPPPDTALFHLGAPDTLFASVAPWTTTLFSNLLLVALVVVGLLAGGAFLTYFIDGFKGGIGNAFERKIYNAGGSPMGYRFSKKKRKGYQKGHSSL